MQTQHKTQKKSRNKIVLWWSLRSAYTKNKAINALLFFLAFLIIGGTNYVIIFHIFVPTIFPLDFFVFSFLVSPIFFFRKTKFDRFYLPIILAFITFICCINSLFHQYFGIVFSLKDLVWAIQNAGQIGVHAAYVPWWIMILNILLFVLFSLSIIFYNIFWFYKTPAEELKLPNHRKIAFSLATMFGSIAAFEITLQTYCATQRNNKIYDIDYVNYSCNFHQKNLGFYAYYTQEIRQFIFDKGMKVTKIKQYCNAASKPDPEWTYTNIFNKLNKNNPNLVVIVLETGDQCLLNNEDVVNQTILPNMYEFMSDGLYCNQNYSWNHTNVSDLITINGGFPQYWFYKWEKINKDFNLPSILNKEAGYQSFYSHDAVPSNDWYQRMKHYPHMGFTNCWFHKDVIPEEKPWSFQKMNFTRDSIYVHGRNGDGGLIKQLEDKVDRNKPFYLHYLSVHMHMNQEIKKGNKDIYQELEREFGNKLDQSGWINPFNPKSSDGKKYRRLTLKFMDFDKALGEFMNYFYRESNNEYLKNTLMCICADHPWYENSSSGQKFCAKLRHINDINNIQQYQTILGFYHPDLITQFGLDFPDHKLNKPTWPSVVAPTILQLLGVKHNPRLYLNKSILDPTYDDHEIFYSFWNARFMNTHYTSYDHYHISNKYIDDDSEKNFIDTLKDLRFRLRMIDTIYKRNIFKKYNYDDFMPLN